ncbi:MAG: peptidoglycan DD-metalloendopeptidase family protein [Marinoscillum sp.]
MIYLIKVSCFHGVLILFYLVFLRKLTFYKFNRFFLLGTIIFGLFLPLMRVEQPPVQEANQEFVNMIATKIDQSSRLVSNPIVTAEPLINWDWLLALGYGLGVFLLFQRYLINFIKIRKFRYGYQLINKIGAIEVFRTPFSQPFSFFKSVFIPGNIEETTDLDLVMAHELEHVSLGHSYDRMFVDFIVVLFWFNPFIYLLRKSLIEVHEYQVDAVVARDAKAKIYYQMSLVKMAGGGFVGPVSFFNFSTIKKRIQMMNQNKSKRISLTSLLILVPVLVVMVSLFSFEMKERHVKTLVLDAPKPIVEHKTIGEKPSVFPVSTEDGKVRVSSTFGMRDDPFDKKRKHHFGIDISAQSGTPVIATAAGEVIELEVQPSGYGKYLVIDHGDGYTTKYAQLSTFEVQKGDIVVKKQLIARVGSSGRSTAPHLHYEVRKDGKPVDPIPYISDYKFSQEIQLKSKAFAEADQAQREAENQRLLAGNQLTEADLQRMEAEQSRLKAEEMRLLAEEQQLAQEENRELLEEERAELVVQRELAEQNLRLAERERDLAEHQELKVEEAARLIEIQNQELELQKELEVNNEVDVENNLNLNQDVKVNPNVTNDLNLKVNTDKVKVKEKEPKDKNKQKPKDNH